MTPCIHSFDHNHAWNVSARAQEGAHLESDLFAHNPVRGSMLNATVGVESSRKVEFITHTSHHEHEGSYLPDTTALATTAKHSDGKSFSACFVIMLIGPMCTTSQGQSSLCAQISAISKHVNQGIRTAYPILVFHDGCLSASAMQNLTSCSLGTIVYFRSLNVTLPESFRNRPEQLEHAERCKSFPRAYRQSSRISVLLMFEDPVLASFDFWFRIDLDITIDRDFSSDPFALMSSGAYDFGVMRCLSSASCNEGLPKAVRKYMKANKIIPTDSAFLNKVLGQWLIFHGNIGIGRVSLFKSVAFQQLARYIDSTGGFIRNRWDDQHMYAIGIGMFSSLRKVLFLDYPALPLSHKHMQQKMLRC
eukprot:CAMPEP_0184289054 /NCGR_PEP_ID=MMETSP1049-20130417/1532_1 /TAXON_ID=77928 /ORGANISM="Proteomonas sulcata, Strain CCMP704" /LENGTH=361 /DNA_ID=CAMNT_0026595703 /DNA_START=377 /DNA_END=1462 /DNA_ORIENTATION=-